MTPENIVLTGQKDFSYRLVRRGYAWKLQVYSKTPPNLLPISVLYAKNGDGESWKFARMAAGVNP